MSMLHSLSKSTSQNGSAVFEILVALGLTGAVALAINAAYDSQDQLVPELNVMPILEHKAKVTADALSEHILFAGTGTPKGITPLSSRNGNPDELSVAYRADSCQAVLAKATMMPNSPLECEAGADCIREGSLLYITKPDEQAGEWLQVAVVDREFDVVMSGKHALSRRYPKGSRLLPMSQARFFVDRSRAEGPALMVETKGAPPLVYAEGVSDLQLQYRLKDGTVKNEPTPLAQVSEVMLAVTVDLPQELKRLDTHNGNQPVTATHRMTVIPTGLLNK